MKLVKEVEKNILLGFAGSAGIGKSTTAEWFILHKDFVRLSFAGPLKSALSRLTGLTYDHFTEIKLKEKEIPGLPGITPRLLMQTMATEYVREMINPDFFIWRMRHSILNHSHRHMVIDDIRFENEAQLVRDNGGIVIHLQREFETITKESKHVSEKGIKIKLDDIVVHCLESADSTAEYIYKLTQGEL